MSSWLDKVVLEGQGKSESKGVGQRKVLSFSESPGAEETLGGTRCLHGQGWVEGLFGEGILNLVLCPGPLGSLRIMALNEDIEAQGTIKETD